MSLMCTVQACTQRVGMCTHEKMLLVVVALLIVTGCAYLLLV